MKTKLALISGALLGLLFLIFGSNFFLHFIKMPPPPEGSPMAAFMGAMYGSGYLAFVKVLEITGGLLVAIPKTRRVGLLILTPIVVNILAINIFLLKGAALLQPPVIGVTFLTVALLVTERKTLSNLVD